MKWLMGLTNNPMYAGHLMHHRIRRDQASLLLLTTSVKGINTFGKVYGTFLKQKPLLQVLTMLMDDANGVTSFHCMNHSRPSAVSVSIMSLRPLILYRVYILI